MPRRKKEPAAENPPAAAKPLSFHEKLEKRYYNNSDPYPDSPRKPVQPGRDASSLTFRNYAALLEQYEKQLPVYHEAVKAWRSRQAQLDLEFRRDLLEELGVPAEHPKAAALLSQAWQDGHAHGYSEVHCHAVDLVELLELRPMVRVGIPTGMTVDQVKAIIHKADPSLVFI